MPIMPTIVDHMTKKLFTRHVKSLSIFVAVHISSKGTFATHQDHWVQCSNTLTVQCLTKVGLEPLTFPSPHCNSTLGHYALSILSIQMYIKYYV